MRLLFPFARLLLATASAAMLVLWFRSMSICDDWRITRVTVDAARSLEIIQIFSYSGRLGISWETYSYDMARVSRSTDITGFRYFSWRRRDTPGDHPAHVEDRIRNAPDAFRLGAIGFLVGAECWQESEGDRAKERKLRSDLRGFSVRLVLVPHWFASFLLLLPLIVMKCRHLRQRHRGHEGECANCGYDLRGNAARCPECGTANPASSGAILERRN
jgi:hypothetical protein